MTWGKFVGGFNQKYYNPITLRAQHNEFLNPNQGNIFGVEAVRKFQQISCLCPFLSNTEEERLIRMMDMFCLDITLATEGGDGPLTTVAECVERAIHVENGLAQ